MGMGRGGLSPSLATLSAEQLQRATFQAVRDVVSRLVAHGPTVLVLEDLHWCDPTSLHLTQELSSLVSQGPLLLVLTRRPEPDPGASALESALSADQALNLRRVELEPLAPEAERELAQALLVREQRRQLHARAAWGLETASTGRTEEVAAVLGHHYAEAGELDRAVHHLEPAGDVAAARFANNEAVASYRDALDLIDRRPPGPNGLGRPVALRFKLGQVLLLTGRRG